MGTIIGFAMGGVAVGFILWIMTKTFYSIGNYGVLTGGKYPFSGVASIKYKLEKIEIKEASNLNGKIIRSLKVGKDNNYIIKLDINNEKGSIIVTFKDENNNVIGSSSDTILEGLPFRSGNNKKLHVDIEFDKFYGEVNCEILKK
ncbi:hypothetical protein ACQPU1_01840 [Clostridium paraputrificum]|uniref:hypothetical protein n=1 Tax=Clostridium paraputrificum TaxID=29363 RepID=UPI003D334047